MISTDRRFASTLLRFAGIGLLSGNALAHDVITTKLTWSREVSRIFYRRCVSCHRDDGGAFLLTNYDAARPWAQAIKDEVLSRRMPPWFAVKGFGEFKHDAGLTQEEIEIISDWVEGGAPKGDEKLLPPVPDVSKEDGKSIPRSNFLEVQGTVTLKRATAVSGIRPMKLKEGASVKVIAERPDGSQAPLIWIYDYNPRFARAYFFKRVIRFPAGTKIIMAPSNQGSVALVTFGEKGSQLRPAAVQ